MVGLPIALAEIRLAVHAEIFARYVAAAIAPRVAMAANGSYA
jgi:hypothetical protein